MTTIGMLVVCAAIGMGAAGSLSDHPSAYTTHVLAALLIGAALMLLGEKAAR